MFRATERIFYMPLYKPGTVVIWRAQKQIISHVMLRRDELWIYMTKHIDPVRPEELQIKPTRLSTVRQPDRPDLQAPRKPAKLPPKIKKSAALPSSGRAARAPKLSSLMETVAAPLKTAAAPVPVAPMEITPPP